MITIFIISGKSGSGKDTIANIMRENYEKKNFRCITLHYADLVKFYCTKYYTIIFIFLLCHCKSA